MDLVHVQQLTSPVRARDNPMAHGTRYAPSFPSRSRGPGFCIVVMKTRSVLSALGLVVLSLASGAGVARAQADDPKPFPPEAVAIAEDAANHLPSVLSRVEAVYPAALKGSGKAEDVFVVFVVTAKGEVTRARVAFGQIPECEQAALTAIGQWKFTPGLAMGHAVNTRMFVRFVFKEAKP